MNDGLVFSNPRGTTRFAGGILDDSDFYPFGAERPVVGPTSGNHYKFTGKERDTESGLDYFGARHYAGIVGRFISPDPEPGHGRREDPQSWNRYSYSRNNPLNYRDPDGKDYHYAYDEKTNTAKVTININLVGPGATKKLAADWQKNSNDKIGGQHQTSSGLKIDVTVNVTADPKKERQPGDNVVNVDPSVKKTEVMNKDGSANQGNAIPSQIEEPVVQSHETLHFAGLADEYDPVTYKPLNGEAGSIMGDYNNPNSKLTQDEIDELGKTVCNHDAKCKLKNPVSGEQK